MTTDGERLCVFEESDLERVVEEMCLSLFVFLKKNLRRWWNNFFLSSEDEEEEEEEEEVFAKNDDGISTGKKIEEKFSFRVLSYKKKKGPHKTLPSTASSQQERTTKRALEGVRVCVCVCRFRATSRVNNTYTQTDRNGAKLVVWWRRPRRE